MNAIPKIIMMKNTTINIYYYCGKNKKYSSLCAKKNKKALTYIILLHVRREKTTEIKMKFLTRHQPPLLIFCFFSHTFPLHEFL